MKRLLALLLLTAATANAQFVPPVGTSSVAVGNITGLGTGVATALAVNVGSAGAPVVLNGAGGTPSGITLTNGTGLPESGVTSLVSDLALKSPLASPTFTGTVTIPTGGAITAPVFGAGSSSASSKPKLTAGTNLGTAEAGAIEYDSTDNLAYFTQSTTEGRGTIPAKQRFYLAADGSNITTPAANYFGTASAITLVANARYRLYAHLYFTKTTAASVQWSVLNQNNYTNFTGFVIISPAAGDGAAGNIAGTFPVSKTAAAGTFQLSASLTTAVNHCHDMFVDFEMGTGGKIEIQAATASGSITPLKGSYFEIERIGTSNTGAFTTNF